MSDRPRCFDRPRCLLAEDDDLLRPVLVELLWEAGFEVQAVGSGQEAVRALADSTFDVVVTDYRMPLGSGLDVLRAARRHSEEFPVIVTSGYADDAIEAEIRREGGVLLHKPFGASRLRQALTALLPPGRLLPPGQQLPPGR